MLLKFLLLNSMGLEMAHWQQQDFPALYSNSIEILTLESNET